MGVWGTGTFENDGALDLVADLRSGTFTWDSLGWSHEGQEYVEADSGQYALALVEIAAALHGGDPSPVDGLDLAPLAPLFTPERVALIAAQARRVLSDADHSELYELWEEAGELEPWLSGARAALERLG